MLLLLTSVPTVTSSNFEALSDMQHAGTTVHGWSARLTAQGIFFGITGLEDATGI